MYVIRELHSWSQRKKLINKNKIKVIQEGGDWKILIYIMKNKNQKLVVVCYIYAKISILFRYFTGFNHFSNA